VGYGGGSRREALEIIGRGELEEREERLESVVRRLNRE